MSEKRRKRYVSVDAHVDERGGMTPTAIYLDGVRYEIDRVTETRRAASFRGGGCGFRYEIQVRGKTTYIWYEGPRWFVEEKSSDPPIKYDSVPYDDWMVVYTGAIDD